MSRHVPLRDRALRTQQTASPRGSLKTHFQAMLERGNSFTRTTAGNRVLTYILEVIQQPERARACGTGAKSSTDRRPVDPPPVVQLSIFELRNGVQTDVSFSYDASFFIFASLEIAQAVGPGRPHLDKSNFFNPATVLTGMRVAGAAYLDRPYEALYFIFPDLSVRQEGKYKLCFNLYETTKHLEDRDISEPGGDFTVSEHATNPVYPTEDCYWRMDIKSANFTVYNAKKFPGLAESTVLSRTVAEQGCRVIIRRDVRMRRRRHPSMEDEGGLNPPYELGLPANPGAHPGAILVNDIAATGPSHVYPEIFNTETTKSTGVQYQQGLGSSVQLSNPQTNFTLNKERSLDHSAGIEKTHASDDPLSKGSPSYTFSITNLDTLGQDHDRAARQNAPKKFARVHNSQWESLRNEIYNMYIVKELSVERMVREIEKAHGLKASQKQLKAQLRKWNWIKYSSEKDKRMLDMHKRETQKNRKSFYVRDAYVPISDDKIENSERRKTGASPSPSTLGSTTYHPSRSDSEYSMSSDDTIALDDNFHHLHSSVSGSPTAISKELIWSALLKCGRGKTEATSVDYSANETAITPVNGEPLSQAIKRSSQEWWLAHSSEPWENILPEQGMIFFNVHLFYLIFSSWHHDWMAGPNGLRKDSHWLFSLSTAFDHEDRLVEQLVHDISLQLHRTATGSVKRVPAGSSTSNEPSESTTTPHKKSYESSKATGKRRDRHDVEQGGDGLDGGDPNQNDGTKRAKRTRENYKRYVICTQFAAGQEPARPNCFFGAWRSVDRLKQDHLVKVHKFENSQMQIDRGGTESEKWWRLFDKLNPGLQEANPEKFIPGPFWEDRVAHNTYNKIFSEAMKRAERIQQRRAQDLASDIQNLLDRHRNGEMQELRQVVLDVLHSRTPDTSSSESLSTTETMTHENGNSHTENGRISASQLQQSSIEPLSSLTSLNNHLSATSETCGPGHASSSNEPLLHRHLWDSSNLPPPSIWHLAQDSFEIDTQPTHNIVTPELSDMLGGQSGTNMAMTTTSSSETMSGTVSRENNESGLSQPFGKVCRCRFHSAECDQGVRDANEWCACCSGWFPWSAFAEPFIVP